MNSELRDDIIPVGVAHQSDEVVCEDDDRMGSSENEGRVVCVRVEFGTHRLIFRESVVYWYSIQ